VGGGWGGGVWGGRGVVECGGGGEGGGVEMSREEHAWRKSGLILCNYILPYVMWVYYTDT